METLNCGDDKPKIPNMGPYDPSEYNTHGTETHLNTIVSGRSIGGLYVAARNLGVLASYPKPPHGLNLN